MKNKTVMFLAFGALIWTFGFMGLSGWAVQKAKAADPAILQTLAEQFGVKVDSKNFHFQWDDSDSLQRKSWKFPFKNQSVELNLESSDLSVESSDSSQIEVEASGTAAEGADLLNVQAQPESIRIQETSAAGSLTVHLKIPRKLTSPLLIRTRSGDVTLNSLISSKLFVETRSGDISVLAASLQVAELRSASGEIEWRGPTSGPLDVTTASGDVRIFLPNGEKTQFDLQSASGDVQNAFSDSAKANGQSKIKVRTASGDIEIAMIESEEPSASENEQ